MKRISFDRKWNFTYSTGTAYLDARGAAYKEVVDLPHDFMIGTKRTPDSRTEGAGGFFQGGIGTYEKTFTVSAEQKGKQFLLQIEGSYGNTEVWINGNLAKLHHYGYTEFVVELTRWLKYGEENRIKIVVENNSLPNSRWYSGSGLYRHVWLLEGQEIYLDPWSVYIRTPETDRVLAEITVSNAGTQQAAKVNVTLIDAEGQSVADMSRNVILPSGKTCVTFEKKIENLKVWDLDSPYLYKAVVTVKAAQTDEPETKEIFFGVRTIAVTRDQGFLLNGTPVKLRGGCIHHDNGIVGSRAYTAMEERKIRLLKESGFNAIRTSHNPMSTALLDCCDRLGMLVLDEAFDCWRSKKNPGDYHLYFEEFWKEDLGSMILRDRNHPSVIMYSTGNEIGERDGSGDGAKISHDMCAFVRSLDKTRPITNGICSVFLDAGEFGGIIANILGSGEDIDFTSLPEEVRALLARGDYLREHWGELTADFAKDLDVVGYNYLDDRYEIDGESFPDRLIVGTESYPKMMKPVWEHTMAESYVLGDFTWTAFDYLGESGIGHALYDEPGTLFCDYPWHVGNCGDFDICGFIRPQGRYRRLLWETTEGPVITVLKPEHSGKKEAVSSWGWADVCESYSWPGCEGKEIRLDIYSKADEVEIKVNGKSKGRIAVDSMWTAQTVITYEPGTLEATEYTNGIKGKTASLTTCGAPEHVSCKKIHTDADDVEMYIIQMEDKNGSRVTWYDGKVKVKLSENAELVGYGTGNPLTEEDFISDTCSLYEGRALLVIRKADEKPAEIQAVVQ